MHNDLLERFKLHLHVLNRSPSTISAYMQHTTLFLKAVGVTDVKQVNASMIEAWIKDLYEYRSDKDQPYSIATICTKIRSVKRFFEFLEKTNTIFIDPSEFITEPKINKARIKPTLTIEEARRALEQPDLSTSTGIRDRAVLEVFYATGIRISELISLNIFDADIRSHTLKVNKGKGYKDRMIPLGRHAIKFIKAYLTEVRPVFAAVSSTTLFINKDGRPLSKQIIATMIRKYSKAAKIKKRVTAHTFRHTFATLMIKNGADIRSVRKMLGHEQLRTTQVYIRSLVPDIKKVHATTHPREKDKERIPRP